MSGKFFVKSPVAASLAECNIRIDMTCRSRLTPQEMLLFFFTTWVVVGREEIEETSEDSTEIGRQRERETAHVAGLE